MLKELFERQRVSIDYFFDQLDHFAVEAFLQELYQCKGIVVFSGVGKSGIVAEKIARTMSSTGTRAIFTPPINFLHGDIGLLGSEDLLVLISKSGQTTELLEFVPFVKQRNVKVLSIVSNPNSSLSKIADRSVCLPLDQELCPFGISPTTSTSIQMIFGDVLSVALMQAKGLTREQYAHNHPSGTIGRKMTMKVEELMLSGEAIPTCSGEETLQNILVRLSEKKCGCLIVTDEKQRLQGIFTDGDLRRALEDKKADSLQMKIEKLMTKNVTTVPKQLLAAEALQQMQSSKWVSVVPVMDKDQVVGVLRMHDIVNAGLGE